MTTKGTRDDPVQWLCDVQEIQLLKARYAEICDAAIRLKDATLGWRLAELFTEDAIIELGPPRAPIKGRQAIAKFYGESLPSTTEWAWHAPGSAVIEINGDRAKGRWIVYALATSTNTPNTPPLATYGRYEDEFVRTSEGWRQTALKFLNETRRTS